MTLAEHLRIIEALQRQDVHGAIAAMDEHMTMAMHRAMGIRPRLAGLEARFQVFAPFLGLL